jgi:hypothetical protein
LKVQSLLLGALVVCVSACAAAPRAGVNEYLDERTGATVTVVQEPLIFALERSTLAAHARDYISLTAVEVDRSGQTQLSVVAYFWSTIDRRSGPSPVQSADKSLALLADDRSIRMIPLESPPKDLEGSLRLHAPETAHFEQAAYKVSLEQLRYVAGSQVLKVHLIADKNEEDPDAETYSIWADGRKALKEFVARISPLR